MLSMPLPIIPFSALLCHTLAIRYYAMPRVDFATADADSRLLIISLITPC